MLDISELMYLMRILKYAPPCPEHGGITVIDANTRHVFCRHCGKVVQTTVPKPVEI